MRIGDNKNVWQNPSCPSVFSGDSIVYCNLKGKYIGITIPGDNKQLTLCEVEAFLIPAMQILPKSAKQSSTHIWGDAANAIDGRNNLNPLTKNECNFVYNENNSVSWTNSDAALDKKNPWWQADFGSDRDILYVAIFHRLDKNILNNFEVSVGNNPDPLKNPTCGGKIAGDSSGH